MRVQEFLNSQHWQQWDADNRSAGSCGIILNDPERYDRIMQAAQSGAEGSTHGEIIEDWREAIDILAEIDDTWDDHESMITDLDAGVITTEDKRKLQAEIDATERWHIAEGTLHKEEG